jgi:branched-chain amino acid transport system substrate-binding protein
VTGGVGSFSQMGFLQGEIAVHALQNMTGPYTFKSVNQAFHDVKDYDTGMLCKPWTFGDYPLHIANNTDYTVTPENGKMVLAQGCTAISSVDPQIAQYHKVAG